MTAVMLIERSEYNLAQFFEIEVTLACIAHKSLEICAALQAPGSGISPAAPENSTAISEKSSATACLSSFILKEVLKQTRSVCLQFGHLRMHNIV